MEIIKANDNNFEDVIKSGISLVDFYADWCGPCQALAPILDDIAKEADFNIIKVNVDDAPNIAAKFQVVSIPTMIIFKDGEMVEKTVGVKQKDEILTWVNSKK